MSDRSYIQHGRRHGPHGSDPIPSLGIGSPGGDTVLPLAILLGTRATQPTTANFFESGGNHLGMRVVIPRTGTLRDLIIYVGNAAGNVELAVLDTESPTRNIVYASGLVAITGSHQYQVIGDPVLPVTIGEQYDFAYGQDDGALTIMWMGGLVDTSTEAASGQLPNGFLSVPGGAPPKITWLDDTNTLAYSTSTVSESDLTPQQNCPLVWARIE